MNLKNFGFYEGGIFESILSTYNLDGTPNAAPMGVSLEKDHIIVRPFKRTRTFKNLKNFKCCVINFLDQVEFFYYTVYKDKALPENWFERAKRVNAPKLTMANLWIETEVKDMEDITEDRAKFLLDIKDIDFKWLKPKVYQRSHHALMESIIHSTRVKVYLKKKDYDKVKELINLINHYHLLIKKVSPNTEYERIMEDILKKIKGWIKIYNYPFTQP
ncbi:hypothetical protein HRbin06_01012 [archaeon HR06]|nr:hypothetical protein HRbin06_01012 [archaeon HR06]